MPRQDGRLAVVTGANAGIGLETARALAHKGAHVVLACRSRERGEAALRTLQSEAPSGSVELMLLDLGSLASIRAFAEAFGEQHERLDLLINNAGVMTPPFGKTEDGFELQIGINFMGHFALTGLLLDALDRTPGSRVVTLSSIAHRSGRIDLDSFTGETPYNAWQAYQQSKLADLMFAIELQRRLIAEGSPVKSLAAHPGVSQTELQRHSTVPSWVFRLMAMKASQGALPSLYAATAPEAKGGQYIGPDGFMEGRGYPAPARIAQPALDRRTSEALWEAAERHTGVRYLSAAPPHEAFAEAPALSEA